MNIAARISTSEDALLALSQMQRAHHDTEVEFRDHLTKAHEFRELALGRGPMSKRYDWYVDEAYLDGDEPVGLDEWTAWRWDRAHFHIRQAKACLRKMGRS